MLPIRLGVIGAGLIWIRRHQPTLATLTDTFQPVAFADPSAERRAQAAAAYPAAAIYADYQALLAQADVDAVLVLTPIALNAPVARAALDAGKDVIMEKPIARAVAEGAALVAAAQAAGKRLYVTEQMGYRRNEEILAEVIASGIVGDLVLWEAVHHMEGDRAQGPMSFASTPWRKQADFPLGTLFDGGIHLIAGLTRVFGRPSQVSATGKKLRAEYGEFDHVAMHFHYAARAAAPGGYTGLLSYSSYLPPDQNHFTVYGSNGTIAVESDKLVVRQHSEIVKEITLPSDDANDNMWQALAAAFRTGVPPAYSGARAVQDVLILEQVDAAIHTNQTVEITFPADLPVDLAAQLTT